MYVRAAVSKAATGPRTAVLLGMKAGSVSSIEMRPRICKSEAGSRSACLRGKDVYPSRACQACKQQGVPSGKAPCREGSPLGALHSGIVGNLIHLIEGVCRCCAGKGAQRGPPQFDPINHIAAACRPNMQALCYAPTCPIWRLIATHLVPSSTNTDCGVSFFMPAFSASTSG